MTIYPIDIRIFFGLVRYNKRFMDGFTSISSPLTILTQNNVIFELSEACERIFQVLKSRLTSYPIFTLSRVTMVFVVYCDESRVSFGYVFMQQGKVVAYTSRQLKVREKNYPTQDLELEVMIFYLKKGGINFMAFMWICVPTTRASNMC